MNRYRLNLIVEILLFPVSDPKMGGENADYLLECYRAYRKFMEVSFDHNGTFQDRVVCNREYQSKKKELVRYLVERNNSRVKSEDYAEQLCELCYPMQDIDHFMKYFSHKFGEGSYDAGEVINSYYITKLGRISDDFITYCDGVAAVRSWKGRESYNGTENIFGSSPVYNKIEIWNLLCRIMTPDIYVAIAAVENGFGRETLYEQQANIALADKLLLKSLQKGVAENHLHFGVAFDYGIEWLYQMNLSFVEKMEPNGRCGRELYERLKLALFRYVAARYFDERQRIGGINDFKSWLDAAVDKEQADVIQKLYEGKWETKIRKECIDSVCNILKFTQEADYLLQMIYGKYAAYHTSSEYLLLYDCYSYVIEKMEDTFFARLFLQYIRLKNSRHHNMQEQNVLSGLKYFQEKYNASKESMGSGILPDRDKMIAAFRSQSQIKCLRKLEIRVAPYADGSDGAYVDYSENRYYIRSKLHEQIYGIFTAYRDFVMEMAMETGSAKKLTEKLEMGTISESQLLEIVTEKIREQYIKIPTPGIVFHFLKSQSIEDLSGEYCWWMAVSNSRCQSLSSMHKRYFMKYVAIELENLREEIPYLSEYIVGIDAASDENAMEPWMFAPVYKEMRTHIRTKPVVERKTKEPKRFSRIQNIGFTYHVGEDFRHIISGLRHIDEILEEFGYKSGDRLGHALALGTDAGQWVSDNEMVPIPKLEHMENLLWIWGVCINKKLELGIHPEELEDKILDMARGIYDHPETITVKMLYEAYRKKFDADHMEIAMKMTGDDKIPYGFRCIGNDRKQCYDGWTVDKLLLTNYCPVYSERYGQVMSVHTSDGETTVCQQLQEYLIRKIEQLGIYVETNPTSNLAIGDFSQMTKHPIFVLNQKLSGGDHHVMVTVNSDDPVVFNTNVENELAYIYYAAESQGYAKSDIVEWIDQIRQYGMDASFVREEKSAEQIFTEVVRILMELRKYKI